MKYYFGGEVIAKNKFFLIIYCAGFHWNECLTGLVNDPSRRFGVLISQMGNSVANTIQMMEIVLTSRHLGIKSRTYFYNGVKTMDKFIGKIVHMF